MTTWGALRTDLLSMLSRSELGTEAGMYLRVAEARINRDVKCRAMERVLVADLVDDGELAAGGIRAMYPEALVDDGTTVESVEKISLSFDGTLRPLTKVGVGELFDVYQRTDSNTPLKFAVDNGGSAGTTRLLFSPAPADGADAVIVVAWYYSRFTLDSTDDNSTNWLLAHHYDVYLNALASAAASHIQDFERQGMFDVNYKRAIAELNASENLSRIGGSAWGAVLSGQNATGRMLP